MEKEFGADIDNPPARPTVGRLVRVAGGEEIELRFVETSTKGVFLALTVDGEHLDVEHGDELHIDVIGAGQSVVFGLAGER